MAPAHGKLTLFDLGVFLQQVCLMVLSVWVLYRPGRPPPVPGSWDRCRHPPFVVRRRCANKREPTLGPCQVFCGLVGRRRFSGPRSRWDRTLIVEGSALLTATLPTRVIGPYQVHPTGNRVAAQAWRPKRRQLSLDALLERLTTQPQHDAEVERDYPRPPRLRREFDL
jgi:hypothetical protein